MFARDLDPGKLHPLMRERHIELLGRVVAAGLPIQPYELWRHPLRQAELYAEGRVDGVGTPGHRVTFEMAWQSAHQHGFAVDWVWWFNGKWSWAPPPGKSWGDFYALLPPSGLITLAFEKPHVQVAGFRARDVLSGLAPYPTGDDAWEDNLDAAILEWGRKPVTDRYGIVHPGAPPPPSPRPALTA